MDILFVKSDEQLEREQDERRLLVWLTTQERDMTVTNQINEQKLNDLKQQIRSELSAQMNNFALIGIKNIEELQRVSLQLTIVKHRIDDLRVDMSATWASLAELRLSSPARLINAATLDVVDLPTARWAKTLHENYKWSGKVNYAVDENAVSLGLMSASR